MIKKRVICYLIILSILFVNVTIYSCGTVDKTIVSYEQSEYIFGTNKNGFVSLAVDEDANVYAAVLDEGISKYSNDGILLKTYMHTESIYGLRYNDGFLYGYFSRYGNLGDIFQMNLETSRIKTFNVDFPIAEVRSFTVSGDYAYILVVPEFKEFVYERTEDMFVSYGEKLYAIKLNSGESIEIKNIENPITMYSGRDGMLYVYSYSGNQYQLLNYDIGKKKVVHVADMDDVGFIFSFAYENDTFIYTTYRNVQAKRLKDNLIYTIDDTITTIFGNTFTYHKGNLIFLEQKMEKYEGIDYINDIDFDNEHDYDEHDHDEHDHDEHSPNSIGPPYLYIRTMHLGFEYASILPIKDKTINHYQLIDKSSNIVISIPPLFRPFDVKLIYERSGINCVYSDQPYNTIDQHNEFLLSIMAGTNNCDIIYLSTESYLSLAIKNSGGYVCLNESDTITDYLGRCFDWVGDTARAVNGDVWMLPLYYQAEAMFYVPKNMERFNIGYDDVSTFSKLLATIEKLNPIKDGFVTFSEIITLEVDLFIQYESLFCDYANKKADFNTQAFKEFYETMWSGWNRKNNESPTGANYHPILYYDNKRLILQYDDINLARKKIQDSRNAATDVIFKTDLIYGFPYITSEDIAEWRAYPSPRINNVTDTKTNVHVWYAVVNPNSENKKLAIRFLEEVAADMLTVYKYPSLVLKDISEYAGHFNMDLPIYRDIHEIMKNGAPIYRAFPQYERDVLVDEYQSGRMTLDEVIDEIQRKVDIWLNE